MEYRTFTEGQKVRSVYGQTYTVISQTGCQVFVRELCNGHIHPSKLSPA